MGRGDNHSGDGPVAKGARISADDRLAVMDLIHSHWARVDRSGPGEVATLFCEDGEMHIGQLVKIGREDIAGYYRERRSQEDASGRKTRHVVSNMLVESGSGDALNVFFLAAVYSGVGDFPLMSAAPSTIADFTGTCRPVDGHGWLLESLNAAVTFVGSGAPAFAKKDNRA